jgi:acid stress chaperone HdeB
MITRGSSTMNPKNHRDHCPLAASSAGAQTTVDMSLISCDQFLKSPQERKDVPSAWMGGYYSAMKSLATIDSRYATQRRLPITAGRRNETLMSATQRNWR